jgi:uncharacterized protein YjbI with pentapeptide repeats
MGSVPTNVEELLRRYREGEREFGRTAAQHAFMPSANLHGATLAAVDLSDAKLRGADLRGANLRLANLRRVDLAQANLSGADLERADLVGACLAEANLSGAELRDADLRQAELCAADLSHANLRNANLRDANLSKAILWDANLTAADLRHADLSSVDLSAADLTRANLSGVDLHGADLTRVDLGETLLADLSLETLCRAGGVSHSGVSPVDFRSIVLSVREPRLKEFLRKSGMPEVFVEYMVDCARSLDPGQIFSLLQSTFISYGGPDEAFARKLNDALEHAGVTTFFFKDDAPPGKKLHRVMRDGVNDHDRVVLVCSESSLQRPGVLNELEETLQREARDGGNAYLLPVRLDDYVIKGWNPVGRQDLAQAVRDRVIADFCHHADEKVFNAELAKLIAVLKKKPLNPIVHT